MSDQNSLEPTNPLPLREEAAAPQPADESVSVAENAIPKAPPVSTQQKAGTQPTYDDAAVTEAETSSDPIIVDPQVYFEGIPEKTLQAAYVAAIVDQTWPVFEENARKPGSYENILTLATYEMSGEALRADGVIKRHLDRMADPEKNFASQLRDEEGRLVLSMGTPNPPAAGAGKMVAGDAGRLEFARRRRGAVRRVPLYNSGFHMSICSPTLDQIHTLVNSMQNEMYVFGREFGAHAYLYNDLLLKMAVVDMIRPKSGGVTTAATLRNWDKGSNLVDQMSILDFPHLMTAIGSTLFPDGYKFRHVCTNHEKKCRHSTELVIDIRNLLRHDFAMMPSECIKQMRFNNVEEVGAEQLKVYREKLIQATEARFGNWGFRLQVPSVGAYLRAGEEFIATMLQETHANSRADVLSAITYRLNRVYTPWVKEVVLYTESGEIDVVSNDPAVISDELMAAQATDGNQQLDSQILDYIADAQVSHVCYAAFACPSCGHVPETRSGFLTVDPVRAFFTMCSQKLTAV